MIDADGYRARGYAVVRGLCSPFEIAFAALEAERLRTLPDLRHPANLRCRWQRCAATGECLFESYDPVCDLSPAFAAMARDPRLLGTLAALLGEPAHPFKDKLIYKPPGATGYDLHQDYLPWPGFPRSFTTVAVAIDRSGPANGGTEFFPGHHARGYLAEPDGDYHPVPEGIVDPSSGEIPDLAPGDAVVFGAFTPHRSARNASPAPRRLLYLSYNADSDGGDRRAAHYAEFQDWLKRKYAEHGIAETWFR